eukprot:9400179-Pyramimonas_sp.AAC.1
MEASVTTGALKIKYGDGWEQYLSADPEWQGLLKTHSDKLLRSGTGKGSGKRGKGGGKAGQQQRAGDPVRPPPAPAAADGRS